LGWDIRDFSGFANVIAGQSPSSEFCNQAGQGLPFLQGNAEFGEHYPSAENWCTNAPKVGPKDSILISVRAPVGEINLADQDYAIGRGLAAIQAQDIDPGFLYHALQRWRIALQRVGQGTTFDAITAKHFRQLRVAVPPPEEQRAIARVLDAVSTAIERTRQTLDQALQLHDGLVVDLLSLGVGSDGKVRDIHRAPEKFGATIIGRTPSDWTVSAVGSEFDIQTGFTLNTNRRPVLYKRKYLRVANVQRARLDLTDVSELEAGEDEFQKRMLREGDLLVVEGHADSMQIGRCATVTKDASGMTFQNHLYCLRPNRVEPDFGCLWLNSPFARRYWRRVCSTTSGLNTINQRKLKRMPFPLPEKRERERICEIERAASALVTATEAKLAHLLRLKRGLMQDLLTGKVRVPATVEVAGA
jgi:type I restriction enzyme S subunit